MWIEYGFEPLLKLGSAAIPARVEVADRIRMKGKGGGGIFTLHGVDVLLDDLNHLFAHGLLQSPLLFRAASIAPGRSPDLGRQGQIDSYTVISPKQLQPSTATGDHEFMSRFAAVSAFEQH